MNTTPVTFEHGTTCELPLNRLKKSPRNARKTPHRAGAIEALAASIAVKGLLQSLVVEPEINEAGEATGFYLVTIGEGRRQAQLLRVRRKEIKKTEPIRCLIDTAHDAHEISLDENVTRSAMHPADQFEAFQRLAEERQMGPEEIGARFGVSAALVRQRLRLAMVDPRLLDAYRAEDLTLDELMAFAVAPDQARQWEVWTTLQSWERSPAAIRRRLTEDRVKATDRRAVFVTAERYEAAGGVIERDLFAEDHGGYFADVALLDRLALEGLAEIAASLEADGWAWAEASFDAPPLHEFRRHHPEVRALTEEEQARFDGLLSEQDALETADEWTDEADARYAEITTALRDLEASRCAFTAEQKAASGVWVSLGGDGAPRLVGGLEKRGDDAVDETVDEPDTSSREEEQSAPPVPAMPDRVAADLSAHRSAALRHRLAETPAVAFFALLHGLVLRTFRPHSGERTCLDLRVSSTDLVAYAPALATSSYTEALEQRHGAWAARLDAAGTADALIGSLSGDDRLALLAHCAALTLSDVHLTARAMAEASPADDLARRLNLDLRSFWTPTAHSYFGRVSKARILEDVAEVSPDVARQIAGAKKGDMALAAERLVAETDWLPGPLRLPAEPVDDAPEDAAEAA